MRNTKLLACASLVAVAICIEPAMAATKSAVSNAELLQRIEKLESELQKQKEDAKSTKAKVVDIEAKAKDVSIDFKDSRPTIKSGDGRFSLSLRARFQNDFAAFMQSDAANGQKNIAAANGGAGAFDRGTGSTVRRAYFGIEGIAFKDFFYELRFDAGGTDSSGSLGVNLAHVSYIGIPHFRVNVGVIQPVFTYGDTVSSGNLTFIERAEIDNIAVDTFGGSDSRRGVEMTFAKDDFLYSGDNLILSGAFTGDKTSSSTGHGLGGDEQTQLLGRAAYRFYSDGDTNAQIGGSAATILSRSPTAGSLSLSEHPEIRVTNSKLISASVSNADGGTMYGFDAAANYKNFYVAGEYHKYTIQRTSALPDAEFSGWYVEASWILTGEHKGYSKSSKGNEYGSWGAPKVLKPFSLSGNSWGAWELAARYSDTDLNDTSAGIYGGEERVWAVGLNWYLNNNIRLMINDLIINVERPNTAFGVNNNFYGQNMNVIAGRLQFAM